MPLIHTSFRSRSRNAGFTLLEVLLTLVILAVGLLGLAAMQVIGLKSGSGSNYRSIATLIALDMADRMRANKDALGTIVGTTAEPEKPLKALSTESLFKNVSAASPAAQCGQLPAANCSSWVDYSNNTAVPAVDCGYQAMAAFDINVMYCGLPKNSQSPNVRTVSGLKMLPDGTMTIVCRDNPCYLGSEHIITVIWKERPDGTTGTTVDRTLVLSVTPMRDNIMPE